MTVIVFGSMGNDFLVPTGFSLPSIGETIVSREAFVHTPGGGKGMNQAVAAARAGSQVEMAGKIGSDLYGKNVIKTLKKDKVGTRFIGKGTKPTGVAFIFVGERGENQIVNAGGANFEATADQVPDDILVSDNTVLCQMETEPEAVYALLLRAKEKGARTILNFAPAIPPVTEIEEELLAATIKSLDYLIVNEIEAGQITEDLKLPQTKDLVGMAHQLVKFSENKLTCIVTCGAEGLIAATPDGNTITMKAIAVNVKDTTGAGDALCGGFAAALDQGYSFKEALKWGTITGGLACREIGCQPPLPYKEEILSVLSGPDFL